VFGFAEILALWLVLIVIFGLLPLAWWIYCLVEVSRAPEPAFGPPWDNGKQAWLMGLALSMLIPFASLVVTSSGGCRATACCGPGSRCRNRSGHRAERRRTPATRRSLRCLPRRPSPRASASRGRDELLQTAAAVPAGAAEQEQDHEDDDQQGEHGVGLPGGVARKRRRDA
jgi:hypothetical protein